jgi:hypothetical protein
MRERADGQCERGEEFRVAAAPRSLAALRLTGGTLAAGLLVAGCSWLRPTPLPPPPPVINVPPPPVVVPVTEASPMEFMRRVRLMNAAELQAASDRLGGAMTPSDKLRLAIVLSAPAHPARDELQARRIAEDVATSDASSAQREFAALLADSIAERSDLVAIQRRMEVKMRDDEKRIEGLEQRLRDTERRVGDAERRASESEKKLEALKQIDKALSDRQNQARPPANGGPR